MIEEEIIDYAFMEFEDKSTPFIISICIDRLMIIENGTKYKERDSAHDKVMEILQKKEK